jgi:hypothetical protein
MESCKIGTTDITRQGENARKEVLALQEQAESLCLKAHEAHITDRARTRTLATIVVVVVVVNKTAVI